jgi:transposase
MHHLDSELARNQISMVALEELVSPNSYARLVDLFVETLPMEELGFINSQHEKEGRPPYHPKVLLKLYMYGYRHGLRSSQKLHQACQVNVELWWLLKGLKPSPRTILYFRKNNALAFKKAFQHFVLLLKEWKLIDGETLAIDSFKIRAQNSLKNNFNQKKVDRHLDYIDAKIGHYKQQLEQAEGEEDKAHLITKMEHQKTKRVHYQSIEKQLLVSGQSQISTVDPDARGVVLHRNIVNVGYNIQAGCDAKYKLFTNAQTGNVNDTRALADMALEAKELLKVDTMNTLTDKGYTTAAEIARCSKNNIITYSSPKDHSSQNNGLYNMHEFRYKAPEDVYVCPAGQTMHTNGSVYQKGNHRVKHYKTKSCKTCPVRLACTTNKNGRFIERGIYQEELENNAKRVSDNPNYYRLRQQVTEHQFGTLKRQWGFTYTLLRGKQQVLSEVYLNFSVYNLIRALKILGPKLLLAKLKKLGLLNFNFHQAFLALLRVQKTFGFAACLFSKPYFSAHTSYARLKSVN